MMAMDVHKGHQPTYMLVLKIIQSIEVSRSYEKSSENLALIRLASPFDEWHRDTVGAAQTWTNVIWTDI